MAQTRLPPLPPSQSAEVEPAVEVTRHKKKSAKKPKVLTGLTCASCGGTVDVREGRTNIECRFCGTGQAVVGDRGVNRVMVINRIDRRRAGEIVQRWLKQGIRKDPALKREAKVQLMLVAREVDPLVDDTGDNSASVSLTCPGPDGAPNYVEQDIAVKVYEEPRVLGGEATLTVSIQLIASCGN